MNTPRLETERLILRRFTEEDMEAFLKIYGDREVNTYLPWFPLKTMEEARAFYEERYALAYAGPEGYQYAVCLKSDSVPIGYVNVSTEESHDLGYGLLKEFWRQGIVSEAARAVVEQVKRDGMPYITATHDVKNPHSGNVMKALACAINIPTRNCGSQRTFRSYSGCINSTWTGIRTECTGSIGTGMRIILSRKYEGKTKYDAVPFFRGTASFLRGRFLLRPSFQYSYSSTEREAGTVLVFLWEAPPLPRRSSMKISMAMTAAAE